MISRTAWKSGTPNGGGGQRARLRDAVGLGG
jgi:hypothetical protein